eukprot:CAMPEP_0168350872 /NCGR_PEP_ID=MMETSP0213-20121227/21447_1 /TAXON_ID=151035 /ORGANISM="Euplotes harpa, Strain FSP1.4" /LENGTH=121 /DNA_ID=CAMNT_0008361441 /DNA_START=324 /DNA_END=686 /DNA_ORIENTATION=+
MRVLIYQQFYPFATIVFSEAIIFNELTADDITISIAGPLSPYSFDYVINSTTGFIKGEQAIRFQIQFTFKSSLAGYYKDTITVKFNNNKIVQDLDENYLETKSVDKKVPFFLVVISDAEKA